MTRVSLSSGALGGRVTLGRARVALAVRGFLRRRPSHGADHRGRRACGHPGAVSPLFVHDRRARGARLARAAERAALVDAWMVSDCRSFDRCRARSWFWITPSPGDIRSFITCIRSPGTCSRCWQPRCSSGGSYRNVKRRWLPCCLRLRLRTGCSLPGHRPDTSRFRVGFPSSRSCSISKRASRATPDLAGCPSAARRSPARRFRCAAARPRSGCSATSLPTS